MNKNYLEEKAFSIASEFTDNELLYIIRELLGWYEERIKQNEYMEEKNNE